MKVKEFLKSKEHTATAFYSFATYYNKPTWNGTQKTKIIIDDEYDYKKQKIEINDYLECDILKIEKYDIPCSDFSFNGHTKDYIIKGERAIINFDEYLKRNPKFKSTLKRLETYYKNQHEKVERYRKNKSKKRRFTL